MAYLRDESGNILKDEAGNNLVDENGAEGETLTLDAGARERTGYDITLQESEPLILAAGARVRTGHDATFTQNNITLYLDAGERVRTGYDCNFNVAELATAQRGGGYPDGPPARKVQRVERRDRDKELDDLIREALNPPAMAEGTPGAEGTAPPSDAAAQQLRASAIKAALAAAKERKIKASRAKVEARIEAILESLADEEDVEILLLAS